MCEAGIFSCLPRVIQATGQSLGSNFVPLNEDPHPGVDVQDSSIRTEGPPLWLSVYDNKCTFSIIKKHPTLH